MDSDYNVGMMNEDKLEQWFMCPNCGAEGFAEEVQIDQEDGKCNWCSEQEEGC